MIFFADKIKEFVMKKKEKMFDSEDIIKSITDICNKDSKAYEVAEYYITLTNGNLDNDEIALVKSKILDIEKYLINWTELNPSDVSTIMQPEESAIILINDLRNSGII